MTIEALLPNWFAASLWERFPTAILRRLNRGMIRSHIKSSCAVSLRLLLIVAFIWLAGCGNTATHNPTRLVLTGSSTVAPLALEIAKRYERDNPGIRVDVQTGGSSRGILDTRRGLADIGMVSRALKPSESDLTAHTLARDGVAIIVHAANPIEALTSDQIKAIYTGQTARWHDVGGSDNPITVVNKAEGRSTLEVFLGYLHLKSSDIKAHTIIGDNEQGIKTVAGNPLAIGYVSIGAAEINIANGVPIKMINLDGHRPSTAAVADGSYPISRSLNLITLDAPSAASRKFLDYARSTDVHDLVVQQSFVAVAP